MTPPTMGKGPRREVGLSANNWISGGDKETIRWSDIKQQTFHWGCLLQVNPDNFMVKSDLYLLFFQT